MDCHKAIRPWILGPLCLLLAGLGALAAEAQPASRVADLNTTVLQPPFPNLYQHHSFEALGEVLFFVADDKIHGAELWRTDGTAAGTRLVKDICPGSCPANPRSLTVSNGLLFFVANDGAHGAELWKTDGTPAGTAMVADIYPGLDDDKIVTYHGMMDVGGVLFFLENDGVHGESLWKTDGTPAGTQFVKSLHSGAFRPPARMLAASGNLLLLAVWDAVHGREPWVSDGTEAGTVMLGDLHPFDRGSIGSLPGPAAGRIAAPAPQGGFLFAADDGTAGTELWYTDGTPVGTVLLKDIAEVSYDSFPHGFTALNGAVYFAASGAEGAELWKTDGTGAGTVLVKDIRPGYEHSNPLEITVAGSRLFFRAADSTHGAELWTSDGTTAGTVLVADLTPGPGGSFRLGSPNGFDYRYGLSALGSDLIFLAEGPNGLQLWRTNGSAGGTVPLSPPNLPESAILAEDSALTVNGRFYFRSGGSGLEIWRSDGTAAGTLRLKNFLADTSAFDLYSHEGKLFHRGTFAALGDLLFFQANDGSGFEPWRSDGTPGGTWRVAQLGQVPYGSSPREIHALGNRAVFLTHQGVWSSDGTPGGTQILTPLGTHPFGKLVPLNGSVFFPSYVDLFAGHQLWKTDGTPAGTFRVTDLSPVNVNWFEITASGDKLFFPGLQGGGDDLWVSDGTAAGTVAIDRSNLNPNAPILGDLNDGGGTLFFSLPAFTSPFDNVLWKSDGTAAGTALVKDIRVGRNDLYAPAYHRDFAAPAGGPLFFAGDDRATGFELWKSDGTEAGTVRTADIFPGFHGSNPGWLTPIGNVVYFAADDGVHGRELWVSDGTAAGTRMVADLLPGPGSSNPDNLTALGSVLLFSAFDGVHGVEPWRTAGRPLGTRMIQDIAPGDLSSSPTEFTAVGPNVFFAANDNVTGFELWTVPRASVLGTFADVSPGHWAWPYVEAIAAAGLTRGCAARQYCPSLRATRAEIAAFLVRALHGADFEPPPAAGTRFQDVPTSHWAAAWIEQLAADGITKGCSAAPPLFCPDAQVTRAEMAPFLLRLFHGEDYTPPPVMVSRFADVPADHWAIAWIEQLAAEGITNGCAAGLYCPGALVGRDEVAAFLAKALHLPLP